MYSYEILKRKHGESVSQTIDSPIMVLGIWEITDVFLSIIVLLIFGVVLYSWWMMLLLIILILGCGPWIKRKHNKGIFFHWPYRYLKMTLPGIVQPKKQGETYSD